MSSFYLSRLAAGLAALTLAGCVDLPSSAVFESHPPPSKLRHADLLGRAMRSSEAGKKSSSLGLIVTLKPQGLIERYNILERYGLIERYRATLGFEFDEAFNGFALRLEDASGASDFSGILDSLSADPDIAWMEPDFSVRNPVASADVGRDGQLIPWSVAYVGARESSARSGDGGGSIPVDVYVVDTGATNPDLAVASSIDFTDSLGTGHDRDGHGTHVSGIIAARDNDFGLVGIAPGARVHSLKVLGNEGYADVSVVIEAIEHLIGIRKRHPNRPMVVNLSLGENVGTSSLTALDETVERLVHLGATVVVAAGNQGVAASLVTPAHVKSVITVGAHDAQGFMAGFSNWGPVVDLLAPGVDVVSLAPSSTGPGNPVRLTGTSMAAPHVAGAAALYLAENPSASPAEVRNALVTSARPGIRLVGPTTSRSVWVGGL